MIQVIRHPDPAVEQEVKTYLATVPAERAGAEHDPDWLAVLHEALGHEPFMLVGRHGDGRVAGYLPLALVAGLLFGRFLVSLPYVNRAGVVADDQDLATALIDRAVELADELRVQYLELRHIEPLAHRNLPGERSEKSLMVRELPADVETLWQSLSPKVRNQIRKGQKHELQLRWGGQELIDAFYEVFAINMRDLGTPVYPRKLFSRILTYFPDRAELAVVNHGGTTIAAAILVHDREVTQVPSASSLRRFNVTNANMWMYHQLLMRAIERDSRRFDFGRSSEGSGTYRFKKQWGARAVRTTWQYHARHGDINCVRPDSPRYRRRIATWQKLPVWVTRLIGPAIVRQIP